MHLQLKFIKPSKFEFLNFPIPYSLLDQILIWKTTPVFLRNFYTHHTLQLTKNLFS